MLKNKEERTSFLRNEKNWEVEYLTPDIKMLTLKLTPKLYVRKIQVMGFNKYFKKSGWYTQFTKFFYPDDLYYSPNTSDTELLRYLTAHKNDDYIEDLEDKCKSYEKANQSVLSIYNRGNLTVKI